MVTTAVETGVTSPSHSSQHEKRGLFDKMTYVLGLGCCMHQRKSKPPPYTGPALEEVKAGEVNWSTSTLGLETDLALRTESPLNLNASSLPLSSIEFYQPPTPVSPPPPVARPQRQQRRGNDTSGAESPVITITDSDIAGGVDGPSRPETRHEQRQSKHKSNNKKQKKEKPSTTQAWSQVDPLYSLYHHERDREARRMAAASHNGERSGGRYSDIRAFDFLSYGGWIVI
jgi:hypothetical protein